MPKKVIFTENAPAPLKGIYNQAIVANGTVYCSGSIGVDPKTNKMVEGDIGARTVGASLTKVFPRLN
jgi:enamine deaminase RidA (YjgF/YER057c/UK114 family)